MVRGVFAIENFVGLFFETLMTRCLVVAVFFDAGVHPVSLRRVSHSIKTIYGALIASCSSHPCQVITRPDQEKKTR